LIVGSESALLCFLARRPTLSARVQKWVDSTHIPFTFGALHWDKAPTGSYYNYLVYNSAVLAQPRNTDFQQYFKIKLVPFSEALPFEARFPIVSRVNLGEADFQRGKELTVFEIGDRIKAAPFICYEIIYPGFVQKRLAQGANLIMTITNDGWFGKTSGPYQHATMARMRSIENGVSLVRCANSGFSMIVDPFGRVNSQTKLFERTLLTGTVTLANPGTFYSKTGDWFVTVCLLICGSGLVIFGIGKCRKIKV
jgi:apolipoprotein N-acyltransferase